MKLFVLTGMPAAGKNVAMEYAILNHYAHFSTGDIVRAEIQRRGFEANPGLSAKISTELRGTDGLGVTRLVIEEALKQKTPLVFLEGIRSWPEMELIRSRIACTLIAVVAPKPVRLERITRRGRADDSADYFDARDRREIQYGVADCIALADAYILNTGTPQEAMQQLDDIIKRF